MFEYLIQRVLQLIPVLVGVTLVTFVLINIVPGDPALTMLGQHPDPNTLEKLRDQLGLNDPVAVRYLRFIARLAVGDLGTSFTSGRRVGEVLLERFPGTLKISVGAMIVGAALGITMGVVAAVNQYSAWDTVTMVVALAFISAPIFWTAIIGQLVFGLYLGWLPISGPGGPRFLVLPALVLGTRYAASIARYTRGSMLEVVGQDYVRTARAKGLSERIVMYKHALKNALIPVVTVIGLEFGGLLTGAILIETIFAIPGIGRLTISAVEARDLPLLQGVVVFTAGVFVLGNLVVDLVYGFIDPRIRFE